MRKVINNSKTYLSLRYFSSIANIRQSVTNNKNNTNNNSNGDGNCFTKIDNKILEFNDIPCARRLPLIGTTLDLIAAGSAPKLHKYIDRRHQELGPIFREKLGSTETVFLSSPNLMRSVFLYEGQYPMHPLPDAWLVYNKKHNCKRGLFFMDGFEWLRNRRIMNKLMLNGDPNNWIKCGIDEATNKITENWNYLIQKHNGNQVEITDLEEQLYRWSINVIISLMFGHNLHENSLELQEIIEEFSQNVHKIFQDSSKLMNFPVKIAEFFKLKIWKEFENDVHKVLSLGYKIIDLGLEKFINDNEGLIGMMLKNHMPLDDVKRIFVDLIIAAGDTTAFSSQWLLYVLSTKSKIQTKTREFILNHNKLESEIPYIRGLIRETLRLYPVAPFIGRYLATDAIFDNYKVDKGTLVILSLYTSGRDESNFPNPLDINPERWIRNSNSSESSSDLISSSKGTLPFAIGSRSCIGRKIALLQMQSLIIKVVSNFELKCLNENPIDIVLRLVAVPDDKIRLQIKKLI